MTIPIENIYFLLCYAWNKLQEKDIVNVSNKGFTNIVNLFARILISGLIHLFKRGICRNYITYIEETSCLRGKLLINESLNKLLLNQGKAVCELSEYSNNVIHNQIIKATIKILLLSNELDIEYKNELIKVLRYFRNIDDIIITNKSFYKVILHRNNYFYDFLLKVCELIYYNILIDEKDGSSKFQDFIQDERQMALLFENFIRNFYKYEQTEYKISRENITWQAKALTKESIGFLPTYQTDISLESKDRKIIIDAKFYKEALLKHYDKEIIRSDHINQLFAYLKNLEADGGLNEQCEGILLYPTVDKEIKLSYEIWGHKIQILTINLNKDWLEISKLLLNILKISL